MKLASTTRLCAAFGVALAIAACGGGGGDAGGGGGEVPPKATSFIKASNTGARDMFGASVALSADGSTLAVGAGAEDGAAPGINGTSNESASNAGAVYVYVRSGSTWVQQAYVKASDPVALAAFGISVALSANGDTLAVGAHGFGSDSGLTGTGLPGTAYVFVRNGATWTQQARLAAATPAALDHFGQALAISNDGNTLVVGAPGSNDPSSMDTGAAHVFSRSASTWSRATSLKPVLTSQRTFGHAVALSGSGTTLAVTGSGAFFAVYGLANGTWSEQAQLTASTGPSASAASVALNGDGSVLAVSSPGEDGANFSSGRAYIYARSTNWTQPPAILKPKAQDGSTCGWSLALSQDGKTAAIGCPSDDVPIHDSGSVALFSRNASNWVEGRYLKEPTVRMNNQFGRSVSLSADGSALAVGACYESSNSRGVNGAVNELAVESGAAYLF